MEAVIIIQIHNSGMVLFWDVAAGKGVRQEWSGGGWGGADKVVCLLEMLSERGADLRSISLLKYAAHNGLSRQVLNTFKSQKQIC